METATERAKGEIKALSAIVDAAIDVGEVELVKLTRDIFINHADASKAFVVEVMGLIKRCDEFLLKS